MLEALFWFIVGLVVGWNLLPQPQWVRNAFYSIVDRLF